MPLFKSFSSFRSFERKILKLDPLRYLFYLLFFLLFLSWTSLYYWNQIFLSDMRDLQSYPTALFHILLNASLISHQIETGFIKAGYESQDTDITICTQLSSDRLEKLVKMAESYRGPISAAVYVQGSKEEIQEKKIEFRKVVEKAVQNSSEFGKYVTIHVVMSLFNPFPYPINFLRNVAWENAKTALVFVLDVDYLPAVNTHVILKSYQAWIGKPKVVSIVPAFEVSPNGVYGKQPLHMEELLHCVNEFDCEIPAPFWKPAYRIFG